MAWSLLFIEDLLCAKYLACACMLSHFNSVQLFATLWTVACQAPLSMGFPRQESWSGLPFPSIEIYIYIYTLNLNIVTMSFSLMVMY